VKSDCSGIKVGYSYCVEVTRQAEPTITTATSAAATPTATKVAKPSPTQEGLIDTCTNFYFTVANDNCEKIAKKFGTFSASEFISWNPAVGDDCSGIWAKTYYCVGIPGTPTAPVATATAAPTSTGSPKPSPTQEGLIDTCTNFYLTVANDNCEKIAKKYSTFSTADFIKWNPAVGSDCSGIWAKTYYCVGVPGTPSTPPKTTTPPTTTKPTPTGNGISTPLPSQPGMVNNCDAFYLVPEGGKEGCQSIADKSGITLAQFLTWNPDVGGKTCGGLWANAYVCVSTVGHTPSKPAPTTAKPATTAAPKPTGCQASHPEPTQPGSVCGCQQWYKPAKGEFCYDVQKKFKISAGNFNKWNPGVGADCAGLWKDTYVCVKN
jgi:hypothetical protein